MQINSRNINTKLFYNYLIEREYKIPIAIKFWEQLIPEISNVDEEH